MTRFTDGPAQGKTLLLARAPLFLRAVISSEVTIDALDRIDDQPRANERIVVYRRIGKPGSSHVLSTDRRGRRQGSWYSAATYALHCNQPDDSTVRNAESWQQWCLKEQRENR